MERQGLFELANGGTLFLDELQSMPIDLQAKLLRVLEDGFIRRIGGTKSVQVNVKYHGSDEYKSYKGGIGKQAEARFILPIKRIELRAASAKGTD